MSIFEDIKAGVSDYLKNDQDRAIDESFKGEVGGLHPYAFNQTIQSTSALSQIEEAEDRSAFQDIYDAASLEANRTITGAAAGVIRMTTQEPGYNAFKDEALVAEGPEFIAKYSDDFAESPNSNYTTGMIGIIKENERIRENLEGAGPSAMLGYMAGGILDITSFIPVIGITSGGSASVLKNLGWGAAQTAGAVGIGEVAQQSIDPTKTVTESAQDVLAGAIVGGLLFGGAAALSKSTKIQAGNIAKNLVQTQPSPTAINDFGKLVDGATKNGVGDSPLIIQDIAGVSKEDLGVARTNWLFDKIQRGSAVFLPEQRILNSDSVVTRAIGHRLMPHNTVTAGNFKGIARKETVINNVEVSYHNKMTNFDINSKKAYTEHKKAGGQLSLNDFHKEARKAIITGTQSGEVGVANMVDTMRQYWREFVPVIKQSKKVPEDWAPKENYFHYEWDFKKLMANQSDVLDDIVEELSKQRIAAGEADILTSDASKAMRTEAQEILEDMILRAQGRYSKPSFTASGLQKRVLNFSDTFALKYLSDDVYGGMSRYTREILSEHELRKVFGTEGNVYDNAQKIVQDDYAKMRAEIDASDASKADKNKRLKELAEAEKSDLQDVVDMIDMTTGRHVLRDSRLARSAAAIAKGISHMRLMGGQALAQIPDLARMIGFDLFKGKFGQEMSDVIGETVDKFKLGKDMSSARRLGIIAEELSSTGSMMSRANAVADLSDAPYATTAEKAVNTLGNVYSKINLADFWNNGVRSWAAEEVAEKILRGSKKLLDGKLKDDDLLAIDLAKYGVDKKFAKQILDQFNKHKQVEDYWNGKVVFSNYESWSPEIQLKFASILKREVDNVIVQPTVGTRSAFISSAVGSVIFQFKGFMLASLAKATLPQIQRMSGMGPKAAALVGAAITGDVFLGAFTGTLRDVVYGRDVDLSPERLTLYGFDRSNFFSTFSYASGMLDKFGLGVGTMLGEGNKSKFRQAQILETLLGPTAGLVSDTANTALRFRDGTITNSDLEQAVRLIPFQNLFYWGAFVNNINE